MKALSVMILTVIAVFILATPIPAMERTIAGRIVGLNCIVDPDLCSVDNQDPHIALNLDFVILLENTDHYLLTNVPREVKIQFFGKQIEVTGQKKLWML